ncbi:MAG: DUF2341 domain-containing protein [Candidatus Hodarchaeota archaeon]
MKTSRNQLITIKKRITVLSLLLFVLIIPLILSSPLFSNLYRTNFAEDNDDKVNDKTELTPKLSAPFNAHYFKYYKLITIDHNQVSGTSGLTNFPFLLSIYDADLRSDVQSDGDDIAFSLTNVWLDHEIEVFNQTYNGTHAKLVVWVRIPVLSVIIDSIIRMYYGNNTMSSRQNPKGVWDNNYKAVYHMNQNPSSSSVLDSTSNNYDFTPGSGFVSGDLVDGIIGKAIEFGGVNTQYLELTSGFSNPTTSLSLEMWFRPQLFNTYQRYFTARWSYPDLRLLADNSISTRIRNNLGNISSTQSTILWLDQYYHFVMTWQGGSVGRQKHYLNGTLITDDYDAEALGTSSSWTGYNLGSDTDHTDPIGAFIEEFRISSNVRSADWYETEFNNQYNPNSFYTIGAEQEVVWEPPNAHYFTYYKLITIDQNEVSGTGIHTNFPYLFSFIDYDLRYHAQPDGDDIAFAVDGDWLDHDIILFNQTYNKTHAELRVWVQIPSLYTTKDTIITMFYGNSTMSSRENPEGVWDSGYAAVYHLDDDFLDSTTNNRDGTNSGSVDVIGKIGDGQDFEHDDGSDNIDIGTWSISGYQITIQAWVKYESFDSIWSGYSDARILSKNSGSSDGSEYHVWMLGTYNESVNENGPYNLRGRIKTGMDDATGTSTVEATDPSGRLSIDEWYLISIKYDGTNIYLVLDGNTVLTQSKTGPLRENSWPIFIGNSPTGNRPIDAIIDEVRISSVIRSDDWLKTEYDNQNDPTSFGTVGEENVLNEDPPNALYFDYHKVITIDHTKVNGTGSHVNFPFLISILDEDLRYDVQSDGDDIAFSLDGQWLDHQIELFNQSYSSSQAKLITWVRIPFLSTVLNTSIIMHYGNDSMSSLQNPEGVWVAYKAVWHLNEQSGSGYYIKDSTSNSYDGSPFGTQFIDSGQIDGSRSFSGIGDNRIIIDRGSEFFDGDNMFTFSFWIYPNYEDDLEWQSMTDRWVFSKTSSVRMSRLWRQSFLPAGQGRFQADIQFETFGTTYLNVLVYRQQWAYITYSYDGTYLRAYTDGELGSSQYIGGFPLITDTSSFYLGRFDSFKGFLDEFRVSSVSRSDGWIAAEYNNQYSPNTFYNVGDEEYSKPIAFVDAQINAVDLYGNFLPNVTISMYQNIDLIESDITNGNGAVSFTNIIKGEYNFTATISSIIANVTEPVNVTPQAILLDEAFQTITLICNITSHFFEIIDLDSSPVESGWIMVGNDTHILQKCVIDLTGHTTFRWVEAPPSEYNYTIYYRDIIYNPSTLELASGDITTENATIQVQVDLTTIEFTVLTLDSPITPVSGAKLKLTVGDPFGASIVNLTTNLDGKATLRWLDSSGIGDDYCLQIEFFGENRLFNDTITLTSFANNLSFTVVNKDSMELRISINLNLFQTELISLNPTDYIDVEWGSLLKLRALFNVSRVETGYKHLLGPSYADSMIYEVLLGGDNVLSGSFLKEVENDGRYFVNLDTSQISSNEKYIIIVSAYKSGYSLPSDLIFQLEISEKQIQLNQSDNDDSGSSAYWLESVNMTLNSYGQNSETLTIENALFQSVDHEFNFMISDVHQQWNLSKIVFNIYDISWNTDISNINITIEDAYGSFSYTFDNSTHSGWDYTQGTWTGITLTLNQASGTNDNTFEFIISGTFDGTVDIIADAYFIRDALNVQYSKFNVSNELFLLTEIEGWAIKNMTFEISNCYYTSNWSKVDLSTLTNLNITTNENFKYSLDYGYLDGTGILTIDDRIIYPLGNQFLFTVESFPDVIFDAIIKVDYIQEFYKTHTLETYNLTKTEQGVSNGGLFQIDLSQNSWTNQEAILWITNIKDGSNYYFPSEVGMNITIGSQTYSISDFARGTGKISLKGFNINQIFQAVIDTSPYVNFSLVLSVKYVRSVSYEVVGSLSYTILEAPSAFGTVQYDSNLGYYLKTIETSLLDADDYTVRFTINKDHYQLKIKDLKLKISNRPTLLNSSSEFFRKIESIYVNDLVNFTFVYIDDLKGTKITDLSSQFYIWESYDQAGNVIDTGQGNLISTLDNTYILDFDTQNRAVGEYLLVLTVDKNNYDRKNGMLLLTINKRILNYSLSENFKDFKSSVVQGKTVPIELTLTDPTQGDIWVNNATVELIIGSTTFELVPIGNGTYTYEFSTKDINAFFTSKTITGKINITRENYVSEEFSVIIVVKMEEIFPGIPTFYFLLVSSAVLVLVGSIVGYKVYQNAKIPSFVKKVRTMKKSIKGNKDIPESVLYRNKEVFIAERVSNKWEKLGFSLGEILEIEGKIEKATKEKRLSEIVKVHEIKPIGLIFMRWDERIGTEIMAKYPQEIVISEKTLMQVYSTHEYSGEKGVITLTAGSMNIISYYSGPEHGYYILLILNLDDDPDLYESGMADVLRILLENIKDEAYIELLPSIFQRLTLYPSLSEEEILTLYYQDEIKQVIIENLREIGLITKSELTVWLRDKFAEEFVDLDSTLSEMLKKEIIKQVSVKGLPSELIFLINDFFMLRVPPVQLLEDPSNRGLPLRFVEEYLTDVKEFFQNYKPTMEDNVAIVNIFTNPEVYQILRLLRTRFATRQDLEKLRMKGVKDIYGALKLLWDTKMIKIFRDEKNNEYYTLLSDFYVDLLFPKYILQIIKKSYEQKSIPNKALIEYLEILEDTYYDLKSKKKK